MYHITQLTVLSAYLVILKKSPYFTDNINKSYTRSSVYLYDISIHNCIDFKH